MKFALSILLAVVLTGCGMKLGSQKDPWIQIPDGFAFSVGVNNIDHVIDRKGLNVEKKAERY